MIQLKRVTDRKDLTYYQTSHFETTTDPKALKSLLMWFDQFQAAPMPHKVWLQCQLALIEGFTNAVRHAHADLAADTSVRIEVVVSEQDIDIRIWDQGPGFNFESILNNKLSAARQDSEGGGRGLKIMYLVADELSYQHLAGQGNCLHIHKTYR